MVAVIILTYNEERHIARALRSIDSIASQVFVIDSFSTDDTVKIASSYGASILKHEFVNQAKQFQWALDNAPISADWIMRLDADEIVEPDLSVEIIQRLPKLDPDVVGINLKRKYIFMNRWIRYGGRHPVVITRIWRRGHGRIENRWMDEHIIVWGGRTIEFDGCFADHNLNDLSFFSDKHNKYATREAIEVLNQKYQLFARDKSLSYHKSSVQAAIKRKIKERFYNELPFWVGPTTYFLYRYFFQLGFIDGQAGLIYHFLQGFWYRFLVGAKVFEYERSLRTCDNAQDRLLILSRLTGHNLQEQ